MAGAGKLVTPHHYCPRQTKPKPFTLNVTAKLRLEEPVEFGRQRGGDDDGVGRAARGIAPTPGGQTQPLLQHPSGCWRRPRNEREAGRAFVNRQRRRTFGLNGLRQRPEAAGQRILAVGHRSAGVRLTDGAANGIHTARARAAAAVNGVRGDGVLGEGTKAESGKQKADAQSAGFGLRTLNFLRHSDFGFFISRSG